MKRTLIAVAVVLIAVCAFTVIKNEYARLLPASGMHEVVSEKHVARLFVGSSTFRRGLDIRTLMEAQENTYILSYNGFQPVLMQQTLAYLRDQGVTTDALYLDFYPYTAASLPKLSDTRLLLDTDTQFKRELWMRLHCHGEGGACDESVGENMASLFEMFVSANNESVVFWPVYWGMNRSSNLHGGSLQNLQGSTHEKLASLPHFGLRDGLQTAQVQAFIEIAEMARRQGIKIYFVETPKYEALQSDADYLYLRDQLKSAIMAQVPDAAWIMREDVAFDNAEPAFFTDLVHLSGEGAKTYTQSLVRELSER